MSRASDNCESGLVRWIAISSALILFLSPIVSSGGESPASEPVTVGTNSTGGLIAAANILRGGYFIENHGQTTEGIRYYSTGDLSVGLRDDGLVFVLAKRERNPIPPDPLKPEQAMVESLSYFVEFEGANSVTPLGREELAFKSNFFLGNDPSGWRTDVPNFGEVVYRNLYDGIDAVFRPSESGVKYEFIVGPRADPSLISLSYQGIDSLQVDAEGALVRTRLGDVHDTAPVSYQGGGERVACGFAARSALSVGFECGDWNRSKSLVIDPLIYSTFLGGSSTETGISIKVDRDGNAYVAGATCSPDFPTTPGAFNQTYVDCAAAYVAKMNPSGTALVYSTLIGGGVIMMTVALAIDDTGSAYLTGSTGSFYFPVTSGAFQKTHGASSPNWDVFVTKLNSQGNALVYSTYLGDLWSDYAYSIDVDWEGNAYVTGGTNGPDFPVTIGSFNTTCMASCGFATKFNPSGSFLVYSTFLNMMGPFSIAVKYPGVAYIGGMALAGLPVTQGAYDTTWNGGVDVFVAKLNEHGTGLDYCTYLGGSGDEYRVTGTYETRTGYLTVDAYGSVYVTASTDSMDFPTTPGAFNRTNHGRDVFVTKLSPDLSSLEYSTFLGGSGMDFSLSIAVDSAGNAYVTGNTSSADFPVTFGAYDTTYNGGIADVFVAKLNATGGKLMYSTFLGGRPWGEEGRSIAVDQLGHAYVAGWTYSADFPVTPGAFDTTFSPGAWEAFVVKLLPVALDDPPDLVVTQGDILLNPPSPVDVYTNVAINATVHNMGGSNASQVVVRFSDHLEGAWTHTISNQVIASIRDFGGESVLSVNWTPDHPDYHDICIEADPDNAINESNEVNNDACLVVYVRSMPDLVVQHVIVDPETLHENMPANVTVVVGNEGSIAAGPFDTALFEDFDLDRVADEGENLTVKSFGGLDGADTSGFTLSWTPTLPGNHHLCACVDPPPGKVVESDDDNNVGCDVAYVMSNLTSSPDYEAIRKQPTDIRAHTGLSMSLKLAARAYNSGDAWAGEASVLAFYNDTPLAPPFASFEVPPLESGEFSSTYEVTWRAPAAVGRYIVRVCVDCDNDIVEMDEMNNMAYWEILVDTWPITSLIIGYPNYTSPESYPMTYVTSNTPLGFQVIDQSGTGIMSTFYQVADAPVDWGWWINYTQTGAVILWGSRERWILWYSVDNDGKREPNGMAELYLDDWHPTTEISPSNTTVAEGALFTLTATDTGCGVRSTEYRIDQGDWFDYLGAFPVPPGEHTVSFRSIDNLGNVEPENVLRLTVVQSDNYKPYVATAFAAVLAAVGCVCSRKKPWRSRAGGKGVLKAFVITSLPFVALEAATGIFSLATHQLTIPPLRGLGIGIDLLILVIGLLVPLWRAFMVIGTSPDSAEESVEPPKA